MVPSTGDNSTTFRNVDSINSNEQFRITLSKNENEMAPGGARGPQTQFDDSRAIVERKQQILKE